MQILSISIFHTLVTKSYSQQARFVQDLSKRTGINSLWLLTQGMLDALINHGLPLPHVELVLQVATPWAFAFRVPRNVSEIWTLDNLPCNFDSLRCEHSDPSHRPHVIHLGYRCCYERLHEFISTILHDAQPDVCVFSHVWLKHQFSDFCDIVS